MQKTDQPRLFVSFGVLCSEDVHCAVITGHADEGRVLVEINAETEQMETMRRTLPA